MPKVYNMRHKRWPANAKKVDRSTIYGNPFILEGNDEEDRNVVCDMFEVWVKLPAQAPLRAQAKAELKGHDLLCWCAPKRCHAETWLCIANEE